VKKRDETSPSREKKAAEKNGERPSANGKRRRLKNRGKKKTLREKKSFENAADQKRSCRRSVLEKTEGKRDRKKDERGKKIIGG